MLSAYVIEQAEPSAENAWAFKFASIWGIYFAAVMILRIATDRLSRVRLKFFKPLDTGGGILFGLVVSLMLTSFAALMLFIPFSAGVWKTGDAPGWQTQTIQSFASPMSSAITAFHGESALRQITSQ